MSGEIDKKNTGQGTETVEQYLARAGKIDAVACGASGVEYPVKRTRAGHINFLKGLDRKRLAEKGYK